MLYSYCTNRVGCKMAKLVWAAKEWAAFPLGIRRQFIYVLSCALRELPAEIVRKELDTAVNTLAEGQAFAAIGYREIVGALAFSQDFELLRQLIGQMPTIGKAPMRSGDVAKVVMSCGSSRRAMAHTIDWANVVYWERLA